MDKNIHNYPSEDISIGGGQPGNWQDNPHFFSIGGMPCSKLDYCSIIWNPDKKEEIVKIERIQRNFISKIKGLEEKNYHERLKILKLYSLERRRERFLIISAWQQIEGKKEMC